MGQKLAISELSSDMMETTFFVKHVKLDKSKQNSYEPQNVQHIDNLSISGLLKHSCEKLTKYSQFGPKSDISERTKELPCEDFFPLICVKWVTSSRKGLSTHYELQWAVIAILVFCIIFIGHR